MIIGRYQMMRRTYTERGRAMPESFSLPRIRAALLAATFLLWAVCPPATPQQSRVLLRSTSYLANLDGLDGADAICQSAGNAIDSSATWIAWLSTSSAPELRQRSSPVSQSQPVVREC